MDITELLAFAVKNKASDLHLSSGLPPMIRVHGDIRRINLPPMEHDDPNAVSVEPGKTAEFAWTFAKSGSFDFACLVPGHLEAGMKGKINVRR